MLVLLHGLGANKFVWEPLYPWLEKYLPGRWIALDLPGHGETNHPGPFAPMNAAAYVASKIKSEKDIFIVGHSMGGIVALALATGWFGIVPAGTIALSTKCEWTNAELQRRENLINKPRKWFNSRIDAINYYLKISGLSGIVDPDSKIADSGIKLHNGLYTLSSEPEIYGSHNPISVEILLNNSISPITLATSQNDNIASIDSLRRIFPKTFMVNEVGHNFHVTSPEIVWNLISANFDSRC